MSALDRHIKEINRLYQMIKESNSENQKTMYRGRIRELEADLVEYCNWRNFDFQKVYAKVVK